MSPYHLELLLFLRYNQNLLDTVSIEAIMRETSAASNTDDENDVQIDPDDMD